MNTSLKLSLLFSMLVLSSCGGGSGGSDQPDNGLAETYPTDLVMTSPYATGDAVEGLTKLSTRTQAISNQPLTPPNYEDKKTEIFERLEGASADKCKFSLVLFRPKKNVTCYGPAIEFANHPDGAPSMFMDTDMDGKPELPTGDVGIWDELEADTGEPCVVAKVNSIVSEAQAFTQTSQDLISSMLCLAKVKDLDTLPEKNASVDLAAAFADIKSDALPLTVSEAKVERLDDLGGHPVYRSSILGVIDGGTTLKSMNLSVNMEHSPTAEDDSTYKGKIWFTYSGEGFSRDDFHCAGGKSQLLAGSIIYEKNSEGTINYHFERAQYCLAVDASPFDSNDSLDPSNKYSVSNVDGWATDFTDIRASYKADTLTGTFSAAWQAGNMDSNTRVFLADLNASDTYTGCGYYGFGPDAADADVGDIDGLVCNWAGPGNIHTPLHPKIQRQCVTYDKTDKKWESDAALLKISYAPVNACSINNTAGFGTSSFTEIDGQTVIAENLFDLTSLPISAPTPPTGF